MLLVSVIRFLLPCLVTATLSASFWAFLTHTTCGICWAPLHSSSPFLWVCSRASWLKPDKHCFLAILLILFEGLISTLLLVLSFYALFDFRWWWHSMTMIILFPELIYTFSNIHLGITFVHMLVLHVSYVSMCVRKLYLFQIPLRFAN